MHADNSRFIIIFICFLYFFVDFPVLKQDKSDLTNYSTFVLIVALLNFLVIFFEKLMKNNFFELFFKRFIVYYTLIFSGCYFLGYFSFKIFFSNEEGIEIYHPKSLFVFCLMALAGLLEIIFYKKNSG